MLKTPMPESSHPHTSTPAQTVLPLIRRRHSSLACVAISPARTAPSHCGDESPDPGDRLSLRQRAVQLLAVSLLEHDALGNTSLPVRCSGARLARLLLSPTPTQPG